MLVINFKDEKYEIKDCIGIAWDGCHKLYVLTTQDQKAEAFGYGYKIEPEVALSQLWDESCPLRFLDFWDVENIKHPIIPQCSEATIELEEHTGVVTITPADPDPDALDEFIEKGELTVYVG